MDSELKPSSIRFLADSTDDKDGAKEVIMDYVISWMLRRAQNVCVDNDVQLYEYCRRFLAHLIGSKLAIGDSVYVETWKQYKRIDIWAYVIVVRGDKKEEHDILIEDKFYSAVHDDQLTRYKKVFDSWLDSKRPESPLCKRHYWLLNCFDKEESKRIYKDVNKDNNSFDVLSWDDMLSVMGINGEAPAPSKSDIFNEFWIEKW